MLHLNALRIPVIMIVMGFFVVGCAAHRADDLYRQKQIEAKQRTLATPVKEEQAVPNLDANQQYIKRGKSLFNGRAVCFGCHGPNGDIREVSNREVAKLHPQPTDLRQPTDKSVRQLYLIIKYGIAGTGMVPIQDAANISDEEVLDVIAYVLYLQGQPLSHETISDRKYIRHTETDVAIERICEQEEVGDYDKKENCEDRYAKRYRDLIIGRPPDIPIKRFSELETSCKQQAAKDLDTLALCYRAEYSATRKAIMNVIHNR